MYIATSIPYVNADPHIGFALELVYADMYARMKRAHGDVVLFSIGTDEHGLKIAQVAQKKGMTPQEHVDAQSQRFRELADRLDISHDVYVRTTDERHIRVAQQIWGVLYDRGYIEKRKYEGLYCVGCEAFKTEKDLINGTCPDHPHNVIEHVAEENYFFTLSTLQSSIEAYFDRHPDFVVPTYRFTEMKEFVKRGLEDISITREAQHIQWGIPVPNDDTQLMYVWFEALMNYLTVAGYGTQDFSMHWPADTIFVGKDINRFHSILFLGMLIALGESAPRHIAVHGHITVNGQKMSKSIGNVVDPFELIEKYGVDVVRYFLLSQIAMENDGDYSEDRLREIYTAHLANGLGNVCSRVTNMIEKYCDGVVRSEHLTVPRIPVERYTTHYAWSAYIQEVWAYIAEINTEIEQLQPWKSIESDTEATCQALERWYHGLVDIAQLLGPVMPQTSELIATALADQSHVVKMSPLFPRLPK